MKESNRCFSGEVLSIVLNNFTNDSRVLKECQSLTNAGAQVSVLAMCDNGLLEEEMIGGIFVKRISLSSRGFSSKYVFKLIKYMEFLFRSVFYSRNKADVIHCNDLNALIPGYFIRLFSSRKVKIIYDAHEYETEVLGLSRPMRQALKYVEAFLLRKTEGVITVGNKISAEYRRLYGISSPVVVMNCPEKTMVKKNNYFREKFNLSCGQKVFLYQGGFAAGRGIEYLLEAFADIDPKDAVLVLMGYGRLRCYIEEMAQKHSNMYYHKAVPSSDLLNFTVAADFGFSFAEDNCLNHRYCLPNKLFEYANAGVPVIISDLPEMRRIVEAYKLGVIAEEVSSSGVRNAVQKALNTTSEQFFNGKDINDLTWEVQEKKLLEVYQPLLSI